MGVVFKYFNMCIIIGKYFKDYGWVAIKNRDRNYVPEISFKKTTKDNIEILYFWDNITQYCEGINSAGVGILSASLMVLDDEKEIEITRLVPGLTLINNAFSIGIFLAKYCCYFKILKPIHTKSYSTVILYVLQCIISYLVKGQHFSAAVGLALPIKIILQNIFNFAKWFSQRPYSLLQFNLF